ncbi:lamin tail domain-containing protein [Anaerolineales bacterium HSG25]|nr:lamin tail domain-containing protein [Anaerolineales bacterium HSG25]
MTNFYLLKTLTTILILMITLIACENSQTTPQIKIINRLPTLTPTVSLDNAILDNSDEENTQTEQGAVVETPANANQTNTNDTKETESNELVNSDTQTEKEDSDLGSNSETTSSSDSTIIIVARNAIDEYVEIENITDSPIDLRGWSILSEKDAQKCNLAGTLASAESLRIWALAQDASKGGYNCGFSQEIWDDTMPDDAILYNVEGTETSRMN